MSKKVTTSPKYIVRTGAHKGQYIGVRLRESATSSKSYAWVNQKQYAMVFTSRHQALAVIRNYGGELYQVA